jgi:hypothetical protein
MKLTNMKNFLSGIALLLTLSLLQTACETDNTSLLTDGIWTFQEMTTDSDDNTIISLISLAEVLLTEATMEFQEGGTYIMDSPLAEDAVTGEWELIGEEQLLLEPNGESASTSNIETLTKDRLSYSESFVDNEMNTYKVTTTWVR